MAPINVKTEEDIDILPIHRYSMFIVMPVGTF